MPFKLLKTITVDREDCNDDRLATDTRSWEQQDEHSFIAIMRDHLLKF